MQRTWVQSLGQEDPLEKEMTTHSSTPPAWKIPWTEEPGRLQPMGLQRVGQDWATSITTLIYTTDQSKLAGASLLTPGPSCYLSYLCVITEPKANTQWGKGQWCVVLRCFSPVWLSVTPWNVNCQDPLSMRFSRQEYWSGFPCFSPGNLLDPGIEPTSLESLALAGGFFTTSATWEAHSCATCHISLTHISLMILPKFMIFGSYNLSMYLEGEWARIRDQSLWLPWHVNSNFPCFFRERHVLVWKKLLHLCSFVGLTWGIMSPDTSVL